MLDALLCPWSAYMHMKQTGGIAVRALRCGGWNHSSESLTIGTRLRLDLAHFQRLRRYTKHEPLVLLTSLIDKPPVCIGIFEGHPACIFDEIGGGTMSPIDVFMVEIRLAQRSEPCGRAPDARGRSWWR